MFSIKKMGNMPGSSSLHRHHKFASFRNGYYIKLNVDKPLYGKIKVMSLARGLCVPVPMLFVVFLTYRWASVLWMSQLRRRQFCRQDRVAFHSRCNHSGSCRCLLRARRRQSGVRRQRASLMGLGHVTPGGSTSRRVEHCSCQRQLQRFNCRFNTVFLLATSEVIFRVHTFQYWQKEKATMHKSKTNYHNNKI